MRALLDTNIIIHRDNKKVTNYSIGHLFRWLDKLKYDKVIHPYSVEEIRNYKDDETQQMMSVKLESYEVIKTVQDPDSSFLNLIGIPEKDKNDRIDNCLLFEVYSNRVDILITEDKKLIGKALRIGIQDKVFSINSFISWVTASNPALIEYKMLGVARRKISAMYEEKGMQVDNLLLTVCNIERISEIFLPDERIADRIYINFCNPWPRNKHKKHRLTHPRQLEQYKAIMKPGAQIRFKTDDDGLFDDSLEYFAECGFKITYLTRDLHKEDFPENIMTEHEKMFSDEGIPIKFLIAEVEGH